MRHICYPRNKRAVGTEAMEIASIEEGSFFYLEEVRVGDLRLEPRQSVAAFNKANGLIGVLQMFVNHAIAAN